MKLKLSPFTVLFLSLNSILIFCASRKVDTEKKTPSALTNTTSYAQLRPGGNLDASANGSWMTNTKIPANKVYYSIGYIIDEKTQRDFNFVLKTSASNDLPEESDEQKIGYLCGTFRDTVSRDRTEISSLGKIKIDAITNYRDLANK
jgi:predicted metalloendopeptidase